jgi:ABC-2 type transport system permease protein
VSGTVPFAALLRSEWVKLRTLTSTWWCLGVHAAVALGVGVLAAATTQTADDAGSAVSGALTGFAFAQVALLVLGVLAMSAEFGSGMVLASLTAVPRRTRVLAAKTVVVALVCAVPTAVCGVLCALAAGALTAVPGGVPLLSADVLRPLGLQVAAGVLVGVLGLGLGTLLRSTAGGVGLGAVLVLALPPVLAIAGGRLGGRISQALPSLRVGEETFLAVPTPWPVGLAVAAAWALVAWVLAAVLLERRDV